MFIQKFILTSIFMYSVLYVYVLKNFIKDIRKQSKTDCKIRKEDFNRLDPSLQFEDVETVGLIGFDNFKNHFHYRTKTIETTGKNETFLV